MAFESQVFVSVPLRGAVRFVFRTARIIRKFGYGFLLTSVWSSVMAQDAVPIEAWHNTIRKLPDRERPSDHFHNCEACSTERFSRSAFASRRRFQSLRNR